MRRLLGGPLAAEVPASARDGFVFGALDASLGYAGLPQSATGQTTLLTGLNGAEIMNGHYGPWPGPTLKRVLDQGTLFSDLASRGKRVIFANAFPPGYFAALESGRQKVNVPVYAAQAAGVRLRTSADYAAGEAIAADLDGGYHASPEPLPEAGKRLAHLAAGADLTFFDFWLSDTAGHRWAFADAVALVEKLDGFLAGLVAALGEVTLLLTSDHGNLEDKSTRSHTHNLVPLLSIGPHAAHFAGAASLLDIAPVLRRALSL